MNGAIGERWVVVDFPYKRLTLILAFMSGFVSGLKEHLFKYGKGKSPLRLTCRSRYPSRRYSGAARSKLPRTL